MIRLGLVALALSLVAGEARADGELLGLQIRGRAQIGGEPCALILRPQASVKKVVVSMSSGRLRQKLRAGKLGRGRQKVLPIKQGVGKRAWQAEFSVHWVSGEKEEFTITLETEVFPKIASRISKEDVDLPGRALTLVLNQPAARVDLTVWGESGKVVYEDGTDFDDVPAGQPLEVQWEQPDDVTVLKIQAKAWSVFGFWIGTEISPFEVEIPHEDVEFATGKWEIRPDETPKLESALAQVKEKVKLYGKLVELQLYIAGFTDTVGGRGSNQTLSEKRARSIGAWFRRRGVRIAIRFQGFGEDSPAVETPDETDEPRNRRAVYTLSVGRPAGTRAAWRPL